MSHLIAPSSTPSSDEYQAVDIFAHNPTPRRSTSKVVFIIGLVLVVLLAGGFLSFQLLNKPAIQPVALTPTPQPTPQVAGLTFGDILKQATSFDDWIAGVKDGNVELINPDGGQQTTLIAARNQWYGPISNLYWSPDKTKIAAIYLADLDAQALTQDAKAHAQSLGLDSNNVSPSAFPYGLLTIIDVANRQSFNTQVVVKNSPKSIVWLDNNNRLAVINSAIQVYDIQAKDTKPLISAGSTTAQQQLASPLVWNNQLQSLYFTQTRQVGQQAAQLLSQVSLTDGTVSDISQIQLSAPASSVFQLFDMALSSDNQRLAIINQQGLAYISLADGAIHQLPYQDSRLWLKQVSLSQLSWISDHRLVFCGITQDDQRLWGGWDVEQQLVPAFAKGNTQGSWHAASGQLAVINNQQSQIYIISPNWSDPAQSSQKTLDTSWSAAYW